MNILEQRRSSTGFLERIDMFASLWLEKYLKTHRPLNLMPLPEPVNVSLHIKLFKIACLLKHC